MGNKVYFCAPLGSYWFRKVAGGKKNVCEINGCLKFPFISALMHTDSEHGVNYCISERGRQSLQVSQLPPLS